MPQERLTTAPEEWTRAATEARAGGYTFFDWLSAVDETDREDDPGLDVLCHLIDPRPTTERDQRTLLLGTRVPEGAGLASLTPLFAGAAWHERETHEMFGLDFTGFDDGSGLGLRPLLLPDGFEGTPLRKSFVLASRAAKPWPGAKEPGEGHAPKRASSRRRVTAPGIPGPEWGPHPADAEPRSKSAKGAPRAAGFADNERGSAKGDDA